jgi:hypothetical protein
MECRPLAKGKKGKLRRLNASVLNCTLHAEVRMIELEQTMSGLERTSTGSAGIGCARHGPSNQGYILNICFIATIEICLGIAQVRACMLRFENKSVSWRDQL